MDPHEVDLRTILRGNIGSIGHGLALDDVVPDRDEYGILVEPMHEALGVESQFAQYVYRSAAARTGQQDAPSEPGDLDLTIYGLRKYLTLALKGNPTVLSLLFMPENSLVHITPVGRGLRALTPLIVSKRAGKAFLGYLEAQRQRLLGERGQKRVKRPDLEEKYGFDTKFAMHMLRLGLQGVELMTTGRFTMPMPEPNRSYLRGVRVGKATLQQCLTRCGQIEAELKDLLDTSPLPDAPNTKAVEAWMLAVYLKEWR